MVLLLQQTIYFAIPLLLVALAGVFAERSGIINLALEGEMIFGAMMGAIFVKVIQNANSALTQHPQLLFILAMLIGLISGAIFSLLLSFSAIKLKADQTIGGTALNLLAPAIVCTFGLLFFNEEKIKGTLEGIIFLKNNYSSGFMQTLFASPLKGVFEVLFDRMYISTYIGIFLFIVLSMWLYKSKIGTHMRACGEHPQAADSVGINVKAMRLLGTTISGGLAGLGGYIYVATCCSGIASSSIAGMGFLALAIMIFGNWNPILIAIGAIMFGFLRCLGPLADSIDFLAKLNLPMYFYNIVPYAIVLVVLIITRNKSGCPKAEGIPYDKGMR